MPSPQARVHAPDTQLKVQVGHAQSPGQVLQFSPQAISQVPLPQFGVQIPLMQVSHEVHPQSAGQELQVSKQGGPP